MKKKTNKCEHHYQPLDITSLAVGELNIMMVKSLFCNKCGEVKKIQDEKKSN
jgi:hypothetical protein